MENFCACFNKKQYELVLYIGKKLLDCQDVDGVDVQTKCMILNKLAKASWYVKDMKLFMKYISRWLRLKTSITFTHKQKLQ